METSWSLEDLATIRELIISGDTVKEVPKDLSVFRTLESLIFRNVNQLKNLSFKYNSEESMLQILQIENADQLETIQNWNVDLFEQYATVSINETPNLKLVSNLTITNARVINFTFNNVPADMKEKLESNAANSVKQGGENLEEVVNGLVDNYSYKDIVGDRDQKPVTLENLNLTGVRNIEVVQSWVDTLPTLFSKGTLNSVHIAESLIKTMEETELINSGEEWVSYHFYIYKSAIDEIKAITGSGKPKHELHFIIQNSTIRSLGEVTLNKLGYHFTLTESRVDVLGESKFTYPFGQSEGIYVSNNIYIKNSYVKDYGKIVEENNGSYTFSNKSFEIGVIDEFKGMELKKTTLEPTTFSQNISIINMKIKNFGETIITATDSQEMANSSVGMHFSNVEIQAMGKTNVDADYASFNFEGMKLEIMPSINIRSSTVDVFINNKNTGTIDVIEGINAKPKTLQPEMLGEFTTSRILIELDKPMKSIGNIDVVSHEGQVM